MSTVAYAYGLLNSMLKNPYGNVKSGQLISWTHIVSFHTDIDDKLMCEETFSLIWDRCYERW